MTERDPILLDFPSEIVGERVVVRAYRPGDGQSMYEAILESREHLKRWMPWSIDGHKSPDDAELVVRRSMAKWILREDFGMGMYEKATGRYLGGTGLHRFDWKIRSFEIGYWIRKSEEGKGLVTETARLLTAFAFCELNANRVFIRCAAANDRSAAIPLRLGFQLEGRQRVSSADTDGNLYDLLVFGILKEEWQP